MTRTSCFVAASVGAAVATIGACAASPPLVVVTSGSSDYATAVKGDPVKLRRGAQEAYVGQSGGFHVVRGHDDWARAWPAGAAPPLPKTVDTSRTMILLGVAEKKDATKLSFERAVETGTTLHVWAKETLRGEGCTDKLDHPPSDFVTAPRVDKPVRIYLEEERAESCGQPPAVGIKCRVGEAATWAEKLTAQPGDSIECEMTAEARGKFALVDRALTMGDLPGGTAAKLAYNRGPSRGAFTVDVFGVYSVRAEALDDAGRRTTAIAVIEALPPKTDDVLVQLVWTNFDVSDDAATFPRVQLRATEEGPNGRVCSPDETLLDFCEMRIKSAYSHMKLKASRQKMPLEVRYVDERVDKGPLVCIQIYRAGARTAETCDRVPRGAGDRWLVGVVDGETGALDEPGPAIAGATDAGATDGADGGAEAGAGAGAK